jgi:hypothetical protein
MAQGLRMALAMGKIPWRRRLVLDYIVGLRVVTETSPPCHLQHSGYQPTSLSSVNQI